MLKSLLFGCLAVWMSTYSVSLFAQTKYSRWAIGTGVSVLRYQPKSKGPDLQFSFYDAAIQVSASKYLAAAFDFHTAFIYSPKVHFPTSAENFRLTSLYDMNYQLRFKINNGVFLKEKARVAPYLSFGIGGSYTQNQPDTYVPLGGGLRFKISNRASIFAQSMRKFSLNKDYQHVEHLISFVYNLKKEELPPINTDDIPKEFSEESSLLTMIPADNDKDGIPNLQDNCPDVFGNANNDGCPEEKPQELIKDETEISLTKQPVKEYITEATSVVPVKDFHLQELETHIPEINLTDEQQEIAINSPCHSNNEEELPPVFFENGSDILTQSAKSSLDEIASILKSCDQMRLVVQGHTDDIGAEDSNLLLSVMRAFKVKRYLVYKHGIGQKRITSSGVGENNPIASNQTTNGREQNRRVDFKLAF